jgi:HD-like signal output (HDOD) protein
MTLFYPTFSKNISGQFTKNRNEKWNLSNPKSKKSPASLKNLSGNELRIRLLRTVRDLPATPRVMIKAQRIISDPSSSLKDPASLVKTDQAMVAKALKMARSAYYGLSSKVSSIAHATVLLGNKAFAELVTISAASKLLDGKLTGYQAESTALWRHPLAVAFGAKIIAIKGNAHLANDAFTAGIIHDERSRDRCG